VEDAVTVTADASDASAPADPASPRPAPTFGRWLAAITGVALAVRVVSILLDTQRLSLADPTYYHLQANLLADGGGFRDPFAWHYFHHSVATAFHPPLFSIVLAIPSWFGFGTLLEHRLAAAVIGTTTVVGIGFLGRRIGGPRAGLIAAGVAAVYPNLWQIDGLLFSEGLAASLVVVALLLAYRLRDRPSLPAAAGLGAVIALAALTRPETILLIVILALPITFCLRDARGARRLALAVACVAACALVLAPWLVRNLTTFDKPVLFSTNGDAVLAVANCPLTYYNHDLLGYWSLCAGDTTPAATPRSTTRGAGGGGDESVVTSRLRTAGLDYLRAHRGQFFGAVLWARLARTWDVWPDPANSLRIARIEGRDYDTSAVALVSYWALAALAVAGIVLSRRRRGPPVWPLLTPLVVVCAVAVYAYGAVRFRAIAEPSILVLAAVAVDAAVTRLFGHRSEAPTATA
jgi:4-amino-4-deoxy-L-arabinose transferase-like glycosyltransferase